MSTVNIDIEDITGAALACEVVFTPLSTPNVQVAHLIASKSASVNIGTSGIGSIVLTPGSYQVRIFGIKHNVDLIQITVPNDALTYSLVSLISEGITPAPQPLFNLMGFAVDADGDLVPDAGLIPGGQFTIDADSDLIPV